ncbi:MAG: ferritin family protein [Desulfobacula sp.]|nr:ferritin family protein [Desulfobacula sp.]
MFTMDDLFDIAIKMEKNGEAVYLDSMTKLSQNSLKSILQWMADEEATHRLWFKDQKDKLSLEINEADLKGMVPDVIQQMMGNKTLSLDDIDFTKMKHITDLLETFIGFEEDTIMFYEMLEIFIEDQNVLKGLHEIVQEEKKHVQKLHEMIDTF